MIDERLKKFTKLNTKNKIQTDSRKINDGDLYVALYTAHGNGHDYIVSAIENGAQIIVHSEELVSNLPTNQEVDFVKVDDTFEVYLELARSYYNDIQKKIKLIGVTGTNGKTSTAWIIDSLLNMRVKSGYIGTLGSKAPGIELNYLGFTSPEYHQYLELFDRFIEKNCEYASIEVSSHGLDQRRVDKFNFDYAIMTNLTHEHLDYHKTLENYFAAKSKLFKMLSPDGKAILNKDDETYIKLSEIVPEEKQISYALESEADLQAINIKYELHGMQFDLKYKDELHHLKTNLIGRFNLYNLLAALAVLLDIGYALEELKEDLLKIEPIEGRMEQLQSPKGINAIIDYGHTPDAFIQVFKYLEHVKKGRIISVFGSAGARDSIKRPIIGEIADQYSDYIVLTEDDPRMEDPRAIAEEIATKIKNTPYEVIPDRMIALEHAFKLAEAGDIIVALSKGRENFMPRLERKDDYEGDYQIVKRLFENE